MGYNLTPPVWELATNSPVWAYNLGAYNLGLQYHATDLGAGDVLTCMEPTSWVRTTWGYDLTPPNWGAGDVLAYMGLQPGSLQCWG